MSQIIQSVLHKHFNINNVIQIAKDKIGNTNDQVYIISTERCKYVLKIHENVNDKYLFNLREKLSWLGGKLPVSKVIAYKIIDNKEYLLCDFIEGIPSFEYGHQPGASNTGIILGESLRKIHDINIQNCPFKINIENDISKLQDQIDNEILVQIKSLVPQEWDLVFSHGDYSLPNILIANNELSGFIDMGDSGIADRNYDLYYGLWSLKFNNLERYSEDFINSYGKDKVSEKKLKLFKLLDDVL